MGRSCQQMGCANIQTGAVLSGVPQGSVFGKIFRLLLHHIYIYFLFYLFTDTAIPIGDFSRVEIQHIIEKMQATKQNRVEQIHVARTNTLF